MNFVFISLQPLDAGRESTSTCLARELSRSHRVLYVNPAPDRKTLLLKKNKEAVAARRRAAQAGKAELVQVSDNFWMLQPAVVLESINWIPFSAIFNRLNYVNNRRLAKEIRKAADDLGFGDFTLVNDKDIFRGYYLKELLRPRKYVYLHRDNTVAMDYWKRHGSRLEPLLMQKAYAVVCNSTEFADAALQHNPRSYYIGNGYDAERYHVEQEQQEPEALRSIAGPRIMYVGALFSIRLDLPLLEKLVAARPEWSFVFVGWEDEDFQRSTLHQSPNVFFIGRRHTREIPAWLAHADVCINPQVVNEITDGNFPLKVLEYLAMGKPVVATATSTMKNVFQEHVRLASDAAGFEQQVEAALAGEDVRQREARLAFVRQFNWANVAENFLHSVEDPKKTVHEIELLQG